MRRLRVALVILATLLLPCVLTSNAQATTCGERAATSFLDGVVVPPIQASYINEASADISVASSQLCTDQADSPEWWTMVHEVSGHGYAQIGYIHRDSGAYAYFWQYLEHKSDAVHHGASFGDGGPVVGASHVMDVSRELASECPTQSGYCLLMYRDGNNCYTVMVSTICMFTPFDPHNTFPSGSAAEFFGETKWAGSDMPGNDSNLPDSAAHFKAVFERDGIAIVSNQWNPANSCPNIYKQYHPYPYQHFYIYTPHPHTENTCQ